MRNFFCLIFKTFNLKNVQKKFTHVEKAKISCKNFNLETESTICVEYDDGIPFSGGKSYAIRKKFAFIFLRSTVKQFAAFTISTESKTHKHVLIFVSQR